MAQRRARRESQSHTHVLWLEHIEWLKRHVASEGRTESDLIRRLIDAAIAADERADELERVTAEERARALREGPVAGDGQS